MSVANDEYVYVLTQARARQAIEILLGRQTHQFFIAYLFLRRTAAREGRTDGLYLDFAEVGEFLQVTGGPAGKPFLRPFWKGQRDAHQEWLNANLAGSYAPSSLRGVPLRVVDIDADRRFSLREDHWDLALKHLLMDVPMPVLPLAAFLFRDHGLVSEADPDPLHLVTIFQQEFGYDDDVEFNVLYDLDVPAGIDPWLEVWTEHDA
jgi:hypothetical protein